MSRNDAASIRFDMSQTSLGTELRRLRGERRLHQVADEAGITAATLSRIEADLIELPSRETLAALSRVYHVPLEHLGQLAYCGTPKARSARLSRDPAAQDAALAHAG